MTVSTLTSENSYEANGVTTVFPYTFRILNQTDLKVLSINEDGVSIDITTGFTVSGAGDANGGNVTFDTAPEDGLTIVVYRDLPYTQPTDYKNQGPFYGSTHERSYDRATMQIQQIKALLGRTLSFGPGVDPLEFLPYGDRTGKYISFDEDGNPIFSDGTGSATDADEITLNDGNTVQDMADRFAIDGDDTEIRSNSSGDIRFITNDLTRARIAGNAYRLDLGPDVTTETVPLVLGQGRSGNGISHIDLVGDATYTDYGMRIIRNAGANGGSDIISHGTGDLRVQATEAAAIKLRTTNTDRLVVTSDGRLYGTALHNNAGSLTGTTNQYFGHSGTWTPTLTNAMNVSASSPNIMNWIRDGNVVHFSGTLTFTPTTIGANTVIDISLPIPSNFAGANEAGGAGATIGTATEAFGIFANTTADRLSLAGWAVIGTSHQMSVSGSYLIG